MEKVVLVTGGGRGIGAGIVASLAKEGWSVAFCGRKSVADMAETCRLKEIEYGASLAYFQCDISNKVAREELLRDVIERFGHIDALVNNAGVAPEVRADLLETSEESFDRLININLKGPLFLTQLVANYFVDSKIQAKIVNIGSVSATVASVSRGEYCISKAGVAMMTKLFAVRMAEFGIPVYELRPGVIRSDMTEVVTAKYDKLIAEGLTLQPRWGEPEDIGRAVAMLLRSDLPYSTGQVINIDGGMEVSRL